MNNPIIVVEGVSANLLSHFSGFARKQLGNGSRKSLLVKEGKPTTIRWVCQYISAGEEDFNLKPKLEHLHIADLCDLYQLAEYLDYASLQERVETLVRSRTQDGLLSKFAIQKIYEVLPSVSKSVIPGIVDLMLIPKEFDYGPYVELASENNTFSKDLEHGISNSLAVKIERGQKYYARCLSYNKKATSGSNTQDTMANRNKAGLTPPAKFKAETRPPPVCYKCDTEGHIARVCPNARICHSCKQTGHISKDCPTAKASDQMTKRSNKPVRGARKQTYRRGTGYGQWVPSIVELYENGEGLRTCDREVKRGEMTRTGLLI